MSCLLFSMQAELKPMYLSYINYPPGNREYGIVDLISCPLDRTDLAMLF